MSNNWIIGLCCFASFALILACLPNLMSPTQEYLNEQLQLVSNEKYDSYTGYSDFYFLYQPSDIYITPDYNSSNIFLYSTVFSNSSSSLTFALETCTSSSNFYSFMYFSSSSGVCRFIVDKSILTDNQRVLFRISCSDGERKIYSAPFVIYSSGYYPVKGDSSDKVYDIDDKTIDDLILQKDSEVITDVEVDDEKKEPVS